MKAMILAAGRGTRVRPLTETLPKPMIPILHKPVMEMLVDHLRLHGFDEIMVNTSYLAPQIENYFRDGQRFGVQMAYSFEGYVEDGKIMDAPVGSAGALQKIQQHSGFFDEDFVVVCGDAVIDLDLTKMMAFHKSKNAIATVALKKVPVEALVNYGVAVMDDAQRITSFQEKPKAGTELSDMANTGIYIFSPRIFDKIPIATVYDIGGELLPALAAAGDAIFGIELPFNWLDIGRLSDYYQVVMGALRRESPPYELPGWQVRPDIWVGPNVRCNFDKVHIVAPVLIGGSATIGDGCSIVGPVQIGANASVGAGASLKASIILDHTRVSGFAAYEHKVVGPNFCFDPEGTVLDGKNTDVNWLFSDARSRETFLNDEQLSVIAHSLEVAEQSGQQQERPPKGDES
jgi:mannose-1-phosphate guanylyltransferase